jgi:hypothetical protein
MVTALAGSPLRLGDYLREGPGDRRFSRGVGITVTSIALVNLALGLAAPLLPGGASDDPAHWSLWLIGLPWTLGFAWLSALQVAGLRAMYRHRNDPEHKD